MDPGKAISTESLEAKGKVHMQVNWYLRGAGIWWFAILCKVRTEVC